MKQLDVIFQIYYLCNEEFFKTFIEEALEVMFEDPNKNTEH